MLGPEGCTGPFHGEETEARADPRLPLQWWSWALNRLIYTATLAGEQGLDHFPESCDGLLQSSAARPPAFPLFLYIARPSRPPPHDSCHLWDPSQAVQWKLWAGYGASPACAPHHNF